MKLIINNLNNDYCQRQSVNPAMEVTAWEPECRSKLQANELRDASSAAGQRL